MPVKTARNTYPCGMTITEIKSAASMTHKNCNQCGAFLPLDAFYEDRKGFRGRYARCKSCQTRYLKEYNQTKNAKLSRRTLEMSPERKAKNRLSFVKRMYGEEAIELEFARQTGAPCEICNSTLDQTVIDHDHETGKVRGILCQKCNHTLGIFNENPEILCSALEYIFKYKPDITFNYIASGESISDEAYIIETWGDLGPQPETDENTDWLVE